MMIYNFLTKCKKVGSNIDISRLFLNLVIPIYVCMITSLEAMTFERGDMDTMRFLVTTSDCVRAVSEVPDAAVERLIEITPL